MPFAVKDGKDNHFTAVQKVIDAVFPEALERSPPDITESDSMDERIVGPGGDGSVHLHSEVFAQTRLLLVIPFRRGQDVSFGEWKFFDGGGHEVA